MLKAPTLLGPGAWLILIIVLHEAKLILVALLYIKQTANGLGFALKVEEFGLRTNTWIMI